MSASHDFFAPVPLGLERTLAEELSALGAARVRASRAGVAFSGPLETGYRACLWSRVASRVLMRIAEVPATSPEELYDGVRELPWEEHVSVDGTIAVDFTASRSPITHTKYGALKVKDAIVDRFRDREGRRPNVDVAAPDLRVNVSARARSAVVSIDLSGDALHRRGYREQGIQVEAPLKENLAAAVLMLAQWPRLAARGGAFLDPMCGSGTLAIEAALIAGDIAPGILRARWGFDGWLGHDEALWSRLLGEADERAEEGRSALASPVRIFASDLDPRAVAIALSCVKRAGLAGLVSVVESDARTIVPPGEPPAAHGLVAFNPPYGERLGDVRSATRLYEAAGARLRERFAGWTVATIASLEAPASSLGLADARRHEVYNGAIPASVDVARVRASTPAPVSAPTSARASVSAPAPATPPAPAPAAPGGSPAIDSMFANRLRKNAKRLGKWARKNGVTCYRLYDADMPEYAVAVDLYAGAGPDEGRRGVHVAEYAPPKSIDPASAKRRLDEAVAAVPEALGMDPSDVHVKVRRRQKGSDQYERMDRTGAFLTVAEDGLLFAVNLADYLDTGLFLDHRITRRIVREMAEGTRFLNLFAYTGAASVYAAAGGAASTLTLDMSATYLDWAKRNFELNGLSGPAQTFERADAIEWLGQAAGTHAGAFDLIFCDPPTFSNSKRMDATFDVQRDHVSLLVSAGRLLAPGGTVVFSNNLRTFRMDVDGLASAGLVAEEITRATIPEDFARNPRIHNAWLVRHA